MCATEPDAIPRLRRAAARARNLATGSRIFERIGVHVQIAQHLCLDPPATVLALHIMFAITAIASVAGFVDMSLAIRAPDHPVLHGPNHIGTASILRKADLGIM